MAVTSTDSDREFTTDDDEDDGDNDSLTDSGADGCGGGGGSGADNDSLGGSGGDDEDYGGGDDDNDLTNLTWLQDNNLLQNIQVVASGGGGGRLQNGSGGGDLEDNENVSPPPPPTLDDGSGDGGGHHHHQQQQQHSHRNNNITSVPPVTYNPQLHRNAKPPYSFSSLIFMAIESSANKALPVKDIYQWIVDHYPYYQTASSGWKNTVRHNLSLNKCFRKLDKVSDDLIPIIGKGSLWCVDPDLRPTLLQAVRRTPAHIYPYMSLAKTATGTCVAGNTMVSAPRIQLSTNNSSSQINKKLSPPERHVQQQQQQSVVNISSAINNNNNLLPFLSKRLLIPMKIIKKENISEADAAVSMLTLQCNVANNINTNNINVTQESNCETILPDAYVDDIDAPVVTVTVSPSNDHNYYQKNSITSTGSTTLSAAAAALEPGEILPDQVYHIIQVNSDSNHTTLPTSTTTTTIQPKIINTSSSSSSSSNNNNKNKRKSTRIVSTKRLSSSTTTTSKTIQEDINDEDSADEGMRGAEALLNLASSNKQLQQQHERPLILKKCKKD